jgi:hypothetical protein
MIKPQSCAQAIAWAAPGVRERTASPQTPATFQADLGDTPPPDWGTEIDRTIAGDRLKLKLHQVPILASSQLHKESAFYKD